MRTKPRAFPFGQFAGDAGDPDGVIVNLDLVVIVLPATTAAIAMTWSFTTARRGSVDETDHAGAFAPKALAGLSCELGFARSNTCLGEPRYCAVPEVGPGPGGGCGLKGDQ